MLTAGRKLNTDFRRLDFAYVGPPRFTVELTAAGRKLDIISGSVCMTSCGVLNKNIFASLELPGVVTIGYESHCWEKEKPSSLKASGRKLDISFWNEHLCVTPQNVSYYISLGPRRLLAYPS